MEGMFLRKKINIGLLPLFVLGLFFIGQYVFSNIVGSEAVAGSPSFLILGILMCVAVLFSGLLNRGAFIRIDEDSIKAKYHWFGRIDCKRSEVAFATSRINTLVIQLTNGKVHTIVGVANAYPLASFIRRDMPFEVREQPSTLRKELNKIKSAQKNVVMYVIIGAVLMFVNLFVTAFLTGERELHQFSLTDWIIFSVMGVIELAIVAATFYLAAKIGKYTVPMEKLRYAIQRRTIETEALLPGKAIKVLTDLDYSCRITVFGYPNESSVYYTVQGFASDDTLIKVYRSEVYESPEELPEDFDDLLDITQKIRHPS